MLAKPQRFYLQGTLFSSRSHALQLTNLMHFELWYNDHLVGTVDNGFLDDGVWHGTFSPASREPRSALERRIAEYIDFWESWNERVHGVYPNVDVSEFEVFFDIVRNGCWLARDPNSSTVVEIEIAPLFFRDGEVSFRGRTQTGE